MNLKEPPLILLIESHEGVRQLIVRFLECNGYAVAGVCTAAQALILVAQRIPNLILCDLNLSDADVSHFQTLRTNYPGIPIIAMSASGDPGEMSDIHFDGWISKPFDFHHLMRLIDAGLRLERKIAPCR